MFRYSYEILVNKQNRLDKAFVPRPLVRPAIPFDASADDPKRLLEADAAQAAEELFAYAKAAGLSLWGISGYRPYSRQAEIYRNAADIRYVAPPGASEHQTGLALDVSCPRNSLELTESFAGTPEGQWLSKKCPSSRLYPALSQGKRKNHRVCLGTLAYPVCHKITFPLSRSYRPGSGRMGHTPFSYQNKNLSISKRLATAPSADP